MTTIRRLTYADLPQVIAIERRAFPAPWSLAMFVLELSKPAGICLTATEGSKIRGYLVCSRYDTVWHVMNVAVDHLQGHVAANFLDEGFEPPFICLLASGGHTLLARVTSHDGYETLGQTLDDAAGEAFDKGARLLGLGYPGGPALSKLALEGDPSAFKFPTAARVVGLDFSFAGLKTALLYKVRDLGPEETAARAADLAASYEHAIVEALIARVKRALAAEDEPRLAIGGGVAANRLLRERAVSLGVPVHVPPSALCTDNAAMIASAARWVEPQPFPDYLALDAYATRRAA